MGLDQVEAGNGQGRDEEADPEVAGHAARRTVRLEEEEVPVELDAEDEDFEQLDAYRLG